MFLELESICEKFEMSSTPVVDKLKEQLECLGINPKPTISEMKKQLKRALRQQQDQERLSRLDQEKQIRDSKPHPFDYYLVFDIEGTCEEDSGFDYCSEIIEFPVILIDSSTMQKVDTFHRFVKPMLNPTLSQFCIGLTGITQDVVDHAQPFDIVYKEFLDWLSKYTEKDCIFVTDGPWDVRDFIEKEFTYYQIKRPTFMNQIIDIRKMFVQVYEKGGNLQEMLMVLGWEFEGRPHCGMDDAWNIARIFMELAKHKRMEATTNLKKHKAKKGDWCKMRKTLADT